MRGCSRVVALCFLQAGEATGTRTDGIDFNAHLLQQGDKKIAQWRVVVAIEGEMLTVPKPPPARRIGRFVFSCVLASPMLLPKRTMVRSSRRPPLSSPLA